MNSSRCQSLSKGNPWSVWEITAMVVGFIVFWPLGLLALFLKWKNGEMWRGASEMKAPWSNFKKPDFTGWQAHNSGNAAFDDYKRATMQRLDEERAKLDEEQKAVGDFVEKLRRAKDQTEFDGFMAERNQPNPTGV